MIFSIFVLLNALALSAVAAYYSILGLTAIFSAAFWPIVIMGAALEMGKISATLWLHYYWDSASIRIKAYLVPSVVVLMFLTSMGIFGYLSKTHSTQDLVSGDVAAQLSIFEEKIKIQREAIDINRKIMSQMDAAVDQLVTRTDDAAGVNRSLQVRKSQVKERTRLQDEIASAQTKINALNEEKIPVAAQVRKVESDVGPIKYIAALMYGDNPDANLLEAAVRWVIIIIVSVFDPLAIVLLLASTNSLEWGKIEWDKKRAKRKDVVSQAVIDNTDATLAENARLSEIIKADIDAYDELVTKNNELRKVVSELSTDLSMQVANSDELTAKFDLALTMLNDAIAEEARDKEEAPVPVEYDYCYGEYVEPELDQEMFSYEVEEEEVTVVDEVIVIEEPTLVVEYVEPWKNPHITVTPPQVVIEPDLPEAIIPQPQSKLRVSVMDVKHELPAIADTQTTTQSGFGVSFPDDAGKGDTYLRIDSWPSKLFMFNGSSWIAVDKESSDSYAYNSKYIEHLIAKIGTGEYDVDDLNSAEQEQVSEYLRKLPK